MGLFTTLGGIAGTILGAGNPIGTAIGSGLGSFFEGDQVSNAQAAANNQNVEMTREQAVFNAQQADMNRDFQWRAADKQMDFQQRMSSTAYSRAVNDMQAAGLNPMLAYGQGGASSPAGASSGGAQASAPSAGRVENVLSPGVVAAAQASEMFEKLRNMRATNAQIEMDTKLKEQEIKGSQQQVITGGFAAAHFNQMSQLLHAQLGHQKTILEKLQAERDNIKSETEKNKFYVDEMMPVDLFIRKLEMELTNLELPGAYNRSSAEGSWYSQNVKPYSGEVGKLVGPASSLGLRLPSRSIRSIGPY